MLAWHADRDEPCDETILLVYTESMRNRHARIPTAMDLEVRHLRLVTEIADAGSMTKAAERLFLTQSALSHQLRDIESRIGTAFFIRVGRRMVLTEAGRRLADAARPMLAELRRTEEDVKRLAGNAHGSIRVTTQCNTGYSWLPPLLAAFHRRHPRVDVNIAADATDRPVDALLDGRVDIAILVTEVEDKRIRIRPLFTDEMVAIVSPSHALAKRRSVSAQELAAEHLLLYSSAPEESFLLQKVLRPAGLTAARVSFIMLTEAMIELARAGVGVGILPRWSAHRAIASRAVVPLSITRAGMRRQWSAATLAATREPSYVSDFIDLVIDRALPVRSQRETA
jgi:LysR family transcriptional regulator for metE and metH